MLDFPTQRKIRRNRPTHKQQSNVPLSAHFHHPPSPAHRTCASHNWRCGLLGDLFNLSEGGSNGHSSVHHYFSKNPKSLPTRTTIKWASTANHTLLLPAPVCLNCSPHHWRCGELGDFFNLSKGGNNGLTGWSWSTSGVQWWVQFWVLLLVPL